MKMDCQNLPTSPPLPSGPVKNPTSVSSIEIKANESNTQAWWTQHLGSILNRVSGNESLKKGNTYELTRRQRRELLPVRTPTRQDKLIWSVPLPEGSYPQDGLPIWERLYLDRKLPMLKCPPNALVFARQQIGKKLWKDTEGQEFILYDPHSYEVAFSYENVHDPHLTTYYEGKEIRGFLLSLGDATEDGWGLCSLKRFNQYRKYLKRVHLSLVHSEMERQEALKDEIHKMKEYKQTTLDTMEALEQKVMMEEVRASIVEALRQYRLNRINRILASIKEKEDRIRKLHKKRERDREINRQKGLLLLAEQELKNKIAMEIKRRKKIATLRNWHDTEEKTLRLRKKQADEKIKLKAEKVRQRWQNKIDNLKEMFERDDEYLKLQSKVREENIKIRNAYNDRLKQKEKDRFQDIRKEGLRKKALDKRKRGDKRMESAIMKTWFQVNTGDFDTATEVYRVKKSINSTMAELLTAQMEGPDRLSIIFMARNRIQREQKIPLQVSFAIDAVLETTIQEWAETRLIFILETIVAQVKENGHKMLSAIKARYKNIADENKPLFKASDPYGTVFQPDPKEKSRKKKKKQQSSTAVQDDAEKEIELVTVMPDSQNEEPRIFSTVVPNYVHYGPVTTHTYPMEYELEGELKSIANRPKTPMPTPEELCEAGFLEEKLKDVLPTLNDGGVDLKEKRKFHKIFKSVAIQLFKRSIATLKIALEPVTTFRAVNKLVHLGETERKTLVSSLCSLIMNKNERNIYESEEFERLAKVIVREAVREVLNPPELRKEEDDGVARTKIMFYAPRPKRTNRR